MVVCIIALFVFGIMGIFSAKYRRYARESFNCVFKMVQLKPCDSDFDRRVKSAVTSKLMFFPQLARFVYKNFDTISWIFVITFFLSIAGMVYGYYEYTIYGNCNGPTTNGQSAGFCVYNAINNIAKGTMSPSSIDVGSHPVRGNASGNVTIIEFACLQCPYSKAAEPVVQQILGNYIGKVRLAFFFFPLPQHLHGKLAATAAYCADDQGKFWEYHDALFQNQASFSNGVNDTQALAAMDSTASQLGLNMTRFSSCLDSAAAAQRVQADIDLGNKLGIKGTPTFFIGSDELVGPQTYTAFQAILDKQLS